MKKLLNITKYSLLLLTTAGFVLTPFMVNADSKNITLSDPNTMVCEALGRVGIGCGASQTTSYITTDLISSPRATPSPTLTNNTNNNSSLISTIFNFGSKSTREDSLLVRVTGQVEIYEIIGGQRHLIPIKDIFYDYGFRDELIRNITIEELNKYPRAKLIRVKGDNNKTYYLTEGQMLRLIPDKKVSDSYGNREEDIIVISKKEFNYYPSDQFVFLQGEGSRKAGIASERPLKRDIFQIVEGKKRYVTPMAVQRMKIRSIDVAPINEIELAYYKTGAPIIN